MAGSPDGLVTDDSGQMIGVIEIKCPFTGKGKKVKDLQAEKAATFFMQKNGDKLSLKQSHNYYAQIQGILNLTAQKWCDFVVWTDVDMYVERILTNEDYMKEFIPTAREFYFRYILPELTFQTQENNLVPISLTHEEYINEFRKFLK